MIPSYVHSVDQSEWLYKCFQVLEHNQEKTMSILTDLQAGLAAVQQADAGLATSIQNVLTALQAAQAAGADLANVPAVTAALNALATQINAQAASLAPTTPASVPHLMEPQFDLGTILAGLQSPEGQALLAALQAVLSKLLSSGVLTK